MKNVNEIFEYFGRTLINAIPTDNFTLSVLELERWASDTVGHRAYYKIDEEKIFLMPDKFFIDGQAIHDLYDISSQYNNGDNHWNKAYFTLFPDHKFKIEFEFDEEMDKAL